jgi:integrase/recombinase XerD
MVGIDDGYVRAAHKRRRHPYWVRSMQCIVKEHARTAGITKRVYPHLLRHSIATILLESGYVPIDQVQKFLGHLQLSTTQIYAQTRESRHTRLGVLSPQELLDLQYPFRIGRPMPAQPIA